MFGVAKGGGHCSAFEQSLALFLGIVFQGVTPKHSVANRQAVAEFQGQMMNSTDLEVFFHRYVPTAPAKDAKIYKFVGYHWQSEGVEAQLDIQYIMGVAPGGQCEMEKVEYFFLQLLRP